MSSSFTSFFPSFPHPHYTTLHPHHNIFAYNPHSYHTSYPDHTQRDLLFPFLFLLSLCVWCGCGAWYECALCVGVRGCVWVGVLIDVAAPQRGDQVKQVFL